MGFYAISPFFCAIFAFLLGILVLLKNFKSPINRSFALLCFETTHWQICWFISYYFTTSAQKDFIVRLAFMVILFVPFTYYHFIVQFLRVKKEILWSKVFYFISSIWLILIWTTKWFIVGYQQFWWGYYPKAGFLYSFYLGIVAIAIVRTLILLSRVSCDGSVSANIRNQNKFVLLATWFYCFVSIEYLIDYGVNIYPIGVYFILSSFLVIAYAILKYRLMDIKVAVTRAGIFLTLYTLVLGFPFWLGYYTKSWLTTGSCMFVLASTGPLIYRFLISKAENMLLAQQKKYQRFLLHAAKGMVREHDLGKLLNLIVHVIKRGMKVQFAAVFLQDKEHGRYVLQVARGRGVVSDKMTIPETHPVIEEMRRKKAPLVHEEFGRLFGKDYQGIPIQLIVPASTGKEVLGFLALGEKSDGSIYTEDDINVFSILSEQATLAIEHCLFLQEFKKQRDRIAEAEKLAGLGGMTSGIAHQFRNRLNVISQIRTNLIVGMDIFKNKYPVGGDKEKEILKECEDTADGLKQEVDRCLKLIGWIIKYAKERMSETDFSFFPLKDCLDMAVSLVEIKHRMVDKERPFEFIPELGKSDEIWAIKGCMDEIMFNLIDNSYESIREKLDCRLNEEERKNYRPFIKVTFTAGEDSYLIKVSDNGVGIKDEDKAKVFMPFFTTKASVISGMGIGMYMIDRLIREWHKGRIWFESEYMNGAVFFIELPKNKK